MLTMNDLHKLALRPERAENSVLTIYLDVDQSKQANLNRGFERQLQDMLATVRNIMNDDGELKLFHTASQTLKEFVARYQLGTRSLALVFDALDGYLWSGELDFPIRNEIRWGREVFVQPLAVGLDEYEPVGIVLLDRAHLRLFTMSLGELEEHIREDFNHRMVRHVKTVGMDHSASASHVQRKADEQIRINLRHVTKDIDAMLEHRGVRRIILGGSPEITAELKSVLTKRLASKVIGIVNIATAATAEEIRSATMQIAEKCERDSEEAIVTDLITSAAKSNRVLVGLGHTLHAVNQHRVWKLVCADTFRAPGYECASCAALFSIQTDACPLCGATVIPVEDVVARAVNHAVRRGATIEIIRSEDAESALMNSGGIGVFLRTRNAAGPHLS